MRATTWSFFFSVVPFAASSPVHRSVPCCATRGRPPTRSSMPPTFARQGRPAWTVARTAPDASRTAIAGLPLGGGGVEPPWHPNAGNRAKARRDMGGGSYQDDGSGATPGAGWHIRPHMRAVVLWACVVLAACGKGASTAKKDDAGLAKPDAAVVAVEPLALGMPDLGSYGWRKRAGHPAFRVARTAE